MIQNKNKVIENYLLHELKEIQPDESQIWSARHKILKRNFTVKKIPYKASPDSTKHIRVSTSDQQQNAYSRIVRVTNLLKRLSLNYAPKCQKIVKTSNNLYLIYDQFPPTTLRDFLSNHEMKIVDRLKIMETLAKTLQEVHSKSVVILGLNFKNIYVTDSHQLFFGNWDLAMHIESLAQISPLNLKKSDQFIAEEVKKFGMYGFESDIFSLGKIFFEILNYQSLSENNSIELKLKQLTNKMLDKIMKNRPSLNEILNYFCQKQYDQSLCSESKPDKIESYQYLSQQNHISIKIKKAKSIEEYQNESKVLERSKNTETTSSRKSETRKILQKPTLNIDSIKFNTKVKRVQSLEEQISPYRKKVYHQLSSPRVDVEFKSLASSKKSDKSSEEMNSSVQSIQNQRNLSIFLMDLSAFVVKMDIVPQLGFLLFKQAFLIQKLTLQQWINKNCGNKEGNKMLSMLKGQYYKTSEIYTITKRILGKEYLKDSDMRKQITQERTNNIFLQQKVLEFGKAMVIYLQSNINKSNERTQLTQIMFKTLMILMVLEEGSYEQFWKKRSSPEYAFLSNQRYLHQQKSMGCRYLKHKVAQILSKK